MPEKDVEVQFQEAVASTLRAMAGGTEHDVVFVGDNTFLHHDKVRLPKLNDITNDSPRLRGEADKIALWIKYHNPNLDKEFAPKVHFKKKYMTLQSMLGLKLLAVYICQVYLRILMQK